MSFFDRLKAGLGKTRSVLTQPLKSLAGVFRNIDEEYLENSKGIFENILLINA